MVEGFPQERPETGAMRFGDDWTGVFLRGDSACWYAHLLGMALQSLKDGRTLDPITLMQLQGLANTLYGCQHHTGEYPQAQEMKPFLECFIAPQSEAKEE